MTKNIFWVIILLVSYSCVEKFDLDQSVEFKSKLVIDGRILDKVLNGEQEIRISRSSRLEEANYLPEVGCVVTVHDGMGNTHVFNESHEEYGLYKAVIPEDNLDIGSTFWLEVITSDGRTYLSSEEEMFACPPVNELYHEVIQKPTTDPLVNIWGAEFFVDFVANENYGAYYRFDIEQTYEYHSEWPIEVYINENNQWIQGPIDFSKFYCYRTNNLKKIFTLSTQGYIHNSFIKYPLHFVDNKVQYLEHNYSILLKQYSLSRQAFIFWDNMRKNNQSSMDMFGTQPVLVKGNITCSGDEDEDVLGFFGVSSVTEDRLVIEGGIDMPYDYYKCELIALEFGFPDRRPLYLRTVKLDGKDFWGSTHSKCWDCTLKGGMTEKPSFF